MTAPHKPADQVPEYDAESVSLSQEDLLAELADLRVQLDAALFVPEVASQAVAREDRQGAVASSIGTRKLGALKRVLFARVTQKKDKYTHYWRLYSAFIDFRFWTHCCWTALSISTHC